MTVQPPAMLYTQGFGSRPENVEIPIVEDFDPGNFFIPGLPIGKRWTNRAANRVWELTSVATVSGITTPTWTQLGAAGGALSTLTGDLGAAVTAVGANIDVKGGASGGIIFNNGGAGLLSAAVQVDGTTITINGSDQLTASGALPVLYFSLTTIGAVTATTANIPVPLNQGTQVQLNVAYVTTNFLGAGGVLDSIAVLSNGGGVLVVNPEDELSINETDGSGGTVDLSASDINVIASGGSNIAVQVLGVAAVTINWRIGITLISTP